MAGNANDFINAIKLFDGNIQSRTQRIIKRSVLLAYNSIRIGSAITGAPGQPVKSGDLLASWNVTWMDRWTAIVSSDLIYAHLIEAGIGAHGPLTLRSKVGGFHSVKLTAMNWDKIVELVTADEIYRRMQEAA